MKFTVDGDPVGPADPAAPRIPERTSPRRTLTVVAKPEVAHRYLWAKTIEGVNLAVHCFHSLPGKSLHLVRDAERQIATLPEAPAYYLCGVTNPYVWRRNSHLLLLPDDDAEPQTVTTPGLSVTMTGVRPVPITDEHMDHERYGGKKNYTTCRNLQAAWYLHRVLGFPNDETTAPGTRKVQVDQAS